MTDRDVGDRDEVRLKHAKIVENSRVVRHLITTIGVVTVAYCTMESIKALAGNWTYADIVLKFMGELSIGQWAAWLLAGGGSAYGLRQRHLRRKAIARLEGRIRELERVHDPDRSSSNLDPQGNTPRGS